MLLKSNKHLPTRDEYRKQQSYQIYSVRPDNRACNSVKLRVEQFYNLNLAFKNYCKAEGFTQKVKLTRDKVKSIVKYHPEFNKSVDKEQFALHCAYSYDDLNSQGFSYLPIYAPTRGGNPYICDLHYKIENNYTLHSRKIIIDSLGSFSSSKVIILREFVYKTHLFFTENEYWRLQVYSNKAYFRELNFLEKHLKLRVANQSSLSSE